MEVYKISSIDNNSVKNRSIKTPKPYAHLHVIGKKSTSFQMNPMQDVEGVAETRSWLAKFKSVWVIHSVYSILRYVINRCLPKRVPLPG